MLTRFNSILIFKIIRFFSRYLICGFFVFFSCEEADYNLDNPNDPENMDLEPPALFFHPQVINTTINAPFSVELYGLKLKPAAAAHLDIRYDWGSVQIDSVVADTFFQSENNPIQIVIDEEGTLDIFIYLLPDTELDQNNGGTWPLATIYMHPVSTGESELLYGENTRLRDANNDSVVVKSFGSGYINVE